MTDHAADREALARVLIPGAFPAEDGENIGRTIAREKAREGADRVLASTWLIGHDTRVAEHALTEAAIDLNNHALALPAPETPAPCENAHEGLCHHDASVTAYIAASQRLTARLGLTPTTPNQEQP